MTTLDIARVCVRAATCVAGVALLACSGTQHASATDQASAGSASDKATSGSAVTEGAPQAAAKGTPCSMGSEKGVYADVTPEEVAQDPSKYAGTQIRVRGKVFNFFEGDSIVGETRALRVDWGHLPVRQRCAWAQKADVWGTLEGSGRKVFLRVDGLRAVGSSSAPVPAGSAETEQSAKAPAELFSGEIVYRQTAIPDGAPPIELGEMHYFISGAHWKYVNASGRTTALYDPERNVIQYYQPEERVVDASQPDGEATFEELPETKVVLGRRCKAFSQTSESSKTIVFYDPTLMVDSRLFNQHRFGHWNEFLEITGGGLSLWSKTETSRGSLLSEAVLIRPRSFEPSFWEPPQTLEAAQNKTSLTSSP